MERKAVVMTLLVLVFFVSAHSARASDKVPTQEPDKTDTKKDEQKGVKFVYQGGKVVKELQDKNDDGKPDVTIYYQNGQKHHGESASHFDGKIDTWYIYGEKGVLRQIGKDTNGDGKPNQFITMIKGRNLILKEYDRNFDGRIDKRKLVEWSASRLRLPRQAPLPGYVPLWIESDDNYDGKIDKYTEKGNKNASKEKIGQMIDGQPASAPHEEKSAPASSEKQDFASIEERRIKQLNDQHGVKS